MQAINSLCILRLSAIGDVCHAAAMVQRVRQHRPDLPITWIIGKVEYQLLKGMDGVEFIIFDKSAGKQGYKELKATLADRRFDAMLVMQVALRANWAARLVKARDKFGFDWHRSKELHWLFANKRIAPQAHAHVLEGFMGFADALGVPGVEKPQWEIPVSEEDTAWARQQREKLGPFAVISPAASKAERNWLPERYAQVAEHLNSKGIKVVLCGGPGPLDVSLGQQIATATEVIARNYIGQTSLKQMLALLQQASLVVAPDTGPAHMATTVATPVIGLYAHSNPRRTGPYNNLDDVVSVYDEVIEEQQSKPWTQLPWGKRAKGSDLMARISVQQVTTAIDKLLAKG